MSTEIFPYSVTLSTPRFDNRLHHLTTRRLKEISKRIGDIIIALTVATLLSPFLLFFACWIRIAMGDPVFYGHRRVGRNGQPFRCYKLRTMMKNSDEALAVYLATHTEAAEEWRATRKLKHDPRITKLGRFLRASSIDELPQLFNVLIGDMSCVGPRPIVFEELEKYGSYAGEYFTVRPGLTGLWQINGRNSIAYKDRVALDVQYIRNWSLRLDFIILLKTIPAVANYTHTS